MDDLTAQALKDFTARYCDAWHEEHKSWPLSEELYGVPSPCIISTTEDAVYWQPQPFTGEQNVNAVERAFDIVIQPTIHTFYTTQFAGDMHAQFGDSAIRSSVNCLPAFIGPTVWELEGPMPILKISNTLIMRRPLCIEVRRPGERRRGIN